jgi:phosphoribosylformimino-5-aminoimidazole carboxamide ribotide isomerase
MFTRWLTGFGAAKFLLGADVREKMIAIHGWQETTSIPVFEFIEMYAAKGVEQVFCTDIQKDGKLEGPSIDLYKEIVQRYPKLFFIASGGVSSVDDLHELKEAGCSGAIIGKAIYENRISLGDLKSFI